MKALRWIADYWYIPLFIVGAIVGVILLTRKGKSGAGLIQKVQTELSAIAAQREARDLKLQLGAEQAKQHVLDKYAEKRKQLDEKAEARVKELEDDPEQLAKVLERLTRS
jgi:delta 1-pyrroline-5-carboxylate dehydrogenase